MGLDSRKQNIVACKQQRRRPAWSLWSALSGKYNIYTCCLQTFKILAGLCGWAGLFELYMVANLEDEFSRIKAHRSWAVACDFQQCGILTYIDSDEPVQPPFKLRNSKLCLVSSLKFMEYSNDEQMLWSDWSEPLLVAHTTLLEISCHIKGDNTLSLGLQNALIEDLLRPVLLVWYNIICLE